MPTLNERKHTVRSLWTIPTLNERKHTVRSLWTIPTLNERIILNGELAREWVGVGGGRIGNMTPKKTGQHPYSFKMKQRRQHVFSYSALDSILDSLPCHV